MPSNLQCPTDIFTSRQDSSSNSPVKWFRKCLCSFALIRSKAVLRSQQLSSQLHTAEIHPSLFFSSVHFFLNVSKDKIYKIYTKSSTTESSRMRYLDKVIQITSERYKSALYGKANHTCLNQSRAGRRVYWLYFICPLEEVTNKSYQFIPGAKLAFMK